VWCFTRWVPPIGGFPN